MIMWNPYDRMERDGNRQPVKLTPQDRIESVIEKYGEGHSPAWIQHKIPDLTKSAVYYHMTKMGYWPCCDRKGGGRGNPFTKFEDEKIVQLDNGGMSSHEIGRTIGRAASSVRMRLSYLASKE